MLFTFASKVLETKALKCLYSIYLVMPITFSSCFYIIKSKFTPDIYIKWMNNLISIVNNFNLVIYTDEDTSKYVNTKGNPRITVIIKPMEKFHNYKYKDYWIENHKKNALLNSKTPWELNMLWSEKVWFVNETIEKKYYDTAFYGWCDIGYFRNRPADTHTISLSNWCDSNNNIIKRLDKNKICYACILNKDNDKDAHLNYLFKLVNNKNKNGLPEEEIPSSQNSIAGGFFIIHKDKMEWWSKLYDYTLSLYFENKYLVKDDQIILVDCILSNINNFILFRENVKQLDNWFMFQRILN